MRRHCVKVPIVEAGETAVNTVAPKWTAKRIKSCHELCVKWLVKNARPFSLPEHDLEFREFVKVLTGGAYKPPTKNTVMQILCELSAAAHVAVKYQIKELLEDGQLMSIAGDIWGKLWRWYASNHANTYFDGLHDECFNCHLNKVWQCACR